MNCQQISKYIYQYCEGKVPAELYDEITRHFRECTDCLYNYKLTRLENSVLSDQTDIPRLNAEFTLKVMSRIAPDYHRINSLNRKETFWRKLLKNKYYLAASIVMILTLWPWHKLLNSHDHNPASPGNIVLSEASSPLRTSETAFKTDDRAPVDPDPANNKTDSSLNLSPAIIDKKIDNYDNKEAANPSAPQNANPDNGNGAQDQNNSTLHQSSGRSITLDSYGPTTVVRQESYAEVASRHSPDKPAQSAKSITGIRPTFIPQNVPMEYKLIRVSILEDYNRFEYQDIRSKETLNIEIICNSEAQPAAADKHLAYGITTADTADTHNYLLKARVQEAASSNWPQPLETNKLVDPQIVITSDADNKLQVIISGNIAPEELARLAKIIQIVEEEQYSGQNI